MSRNPSMPAHQMRQQGDAHRPALLDALGMDPLRDWDDIVNAARCLVKERHELRGRDRQAKAAIREALRLLDDWQTAEELGTVEEWAVQIADTLAPLAEPGHP